MTSEAIIADSGVPFTIVRATQFHDFAGGFFAAQRHLPLRVALAVPVNSIRIEEVAARLVELATGKPAGRVADIGGPQHLTVGDALDQWQVAHGTDRRVLTMKVPGKIGAAFAAGHHMTPLPGYGTGTFAEYAVDHARRDTNEA